MDEQNNQNSKAHGSASLEKFAEELIREKNSPYVTSENFQSVKEMLIDEISQAINTKLVSLLSDTDVEELNQHLDENATDQQLYVFFSHKIPHINQEITNTLIDFRKGYLSVVPQNLANVSQDNNLDMPPPPPAPAEED